MNHLQLVTLTYDFAPARRFQNEVSFFIYFFIIIFSLTEKTTRQLSFKATKQKKIRSNKQTNLNELHFLNISNTKHNLIVSTCKCILIGSYGLEYIPFFAVIGHFYLCSLGF